MAFPPTLPSTVDVTDATSMASKHAPDHNLIADALNDLTIRLTSNAWGIVLNGLAKVVANQSISSTATPGTAITGASCTVATLANRRYEIRWSANVSADGANSIGSIVLLRDGTAIQRRDVPMNIVGNVYPATIYVVDAPSAGSHTYTVNMWRSAGTAAIWNQATATNICELVVMDVGPTVPT